MMTRLGKFLAVGALVTTPLAIATFPAQPASAQVYVSPYYGYGYGSPYACTYYDPYNCGYGWYGYPYYGAGWGWGGGWYGGGWSGRGWHGGGRAGWHGGRGGHAGGGHWRH